jgi:hypothetical protein
MPAMIQRKVAALAARMSRSNSARVLKLSPSLPGDLPWLAAGLAGNVALHAAMDLAPHTYPVPWRLDIAGSIMLMAVVLVAVRPRFLPLFAAAFLVRNHFHRRGGPPGMKTVS